MEIFYKNNSFFFLNFMVYINSVRVLKEPTKY